MKPTDAWGSILDVELTEEQETWYDDGWDDGYVEGYQQALVDACGVVTALFVRNADDAEEADNG